MHVIVLGAGVVGVTTAYYLSQLGCQVTVVDRASDVCDGASHANGGQLSYSFTDALARPGFVASIPGLLLGRDPGARVRVAPSLVGWGLKFLSQCTNSRAESNTIAVLETAMRSAKLMNELRERAPFEFSHRKAGKLVLLSDRAELKAAAATSALKKAHGCNTEILTRAEALALEPAIEHMSADYLGAVFSRDDAVADARSFTTGMRDWLLEGGSVSFRLESDVKELVTENGCAKAAIIGDERLDADAVVVCMGAWSNRLLRSVGINPQVYPVRGYSVTLPPTDSSPTISLTALKQRIVFSRINGFMRIAGFADFTGFDTTADSERTAALLDVARDVAPVAAGYDAENVHEWGGFRPMTPNGRPRVGPTGIRGLFMNTGHGMLGWTLACASGYDTAQAVAQTH